MDNSSGVGVIDKAALVLAALEAGPQTLADLVTSTGISRPTAHRLATALEHHRLVSRDLQGRFVLGPRCLELANATGQDLLISVADPILRALADSTGESAQLYRKQGTQRICVAAAERASGLRDSVPIGAALAMNAGSAAQILMAWDDADSLQAGLAEAAFDARILSAVRRRGWAQSVGERESGVGSVSAPVRGPNGKVIAAVSISGPLERLTRAPGRLHASAVTRAAKQVTVLLAEHSQ
ncbi:MAG: IclR family transcriptional regulator [Actinomycetes bacterium]|jgi:hypothetical protein